MNEIAVGVFGGSFDPPHFGHLSLIVSAIEQLQLDAVYVVPTSSNPLKLYSQTPPSIRFEMTRLAFSGIPQVVVIDYEVKQERVCYTIDTVEWMMEAIPGFSEAKRYLLLGEDCFHQLPAWKKSERLLCLMSLVVAQRYNGIRETIDKSISNTTLNEKTIITRRMDISSTEIRARIGKGLTCSFMLPQSVLDYCKERRLYK
jgi:nicotinate-nucleotide adenylyltransferase